MGKNNFEPFLGLTLLGLRALIALMSDRSLTLNKVIGSYPLIPQ